MNTVTKDTDYENSIIINFIDFCLNFFSGIYNIDRLLKIQIRDNIDEQSQNEIRDFLFNNELTSVDNNQLVALYDEDLKTLKLHSLFGQLDFDIENIQKLLIMKNENLINFTTPLHLQLSFITIPQKLNINNISSLTENAISSLFKMLINVNPNLYSNDYVTNINKNIHDLSMRLLNLQNTITTPDFKATANEIIREIVIKGAKLTNFTEFLPETYMNDSNFLNSLQSTVNIWIKNILVLTTLADNDFEGSIDHELTFWSNLSTVMTSILKSLNSTEVIITFTILLEAKRFKSLTTVISDTRLLEYVKQTSDYKDFLLSLPISKINDCDILTALKDLIYTLCMKLKTFGISQKSVERFISLLQKLDKHLRNKLITIVPCMLKQTYSEFINNSDILIRTINFWEKSYNDLIVQARKCIRDNKLTDVQTIYKVSDTGEFKEFIKNIIKFRKEHEKFRIRVEKLHFLDLTKDVNHLYEIIESQAFGASSVIEDFNEARTNFNNAYLNLQDSISTRFQNDLENKITPSELYLHLYRFKYIREYIPILRGTYTQAFQLYIKYLKVEIDQLESISHNKSFLKKTLSSKDMTLFSSNVILMHQISTHVKNILLSLKNLNCDKIIDGNEFLNIVHSCEILIDSNDIKTELSTWKYDSFGNEHLIDSQPVFTIMLNEKGIYELNLNFNYQVLGNIKDFKTLMFSGIDMPDDLLIDIMHFEEITPFYYSVLENVQIFFNTLENIKSKPFCNILLSTQVHNIWDLVHEGMLTNWGQIFNRSISIGNEQNFINRFEKSIYKLVEMYSIVNNSNEILNVIFKKLLDTPFDKDDLNLIINELQAELYNIDIFDDNEINYCITYFNIAIRYILIAKITKYLKNFQLSYTKVTVNMSNLAINFCPDLGTLSNILISEFHNQLKSIFKINSLRLKNPQNSTDTSFFYDLSLFQDVVTETTSRILGQINDILEILTDWKHYEQMWYFNEDKIVAHASNDLNKLNSLFLTLFHDRQKLYDLYKCTNIPILDVDYGNTYSVIDNKLRAYEKILIQHLVSCYSKKSEQFSKTVVGLKDQLILADLNFGSLYSAIEYIIFVIEITEKIDLFKNELSHYKNYQKTITMSKIRLPLTFMFVEQLECDFNDLLQIHESKYKILEANHSQFDTIFLTETNKIKGTIDSLINDWDIAKDITFASLLLDEKLSIISEFEKKAHTLVQKIAQIHTASKLLVIPIYLENNRVEILTNELSDQKTKYLKGKMLTTDLENVLHQKWSSTLIPHIMEKIRLIVSQLSDLIREGQKELSYSFVHYSSDQFKELLLILEKLKDSSIKKRHWQTVFFKFSTERIPEKIIEDLNFTIEDVLTIDFSKHVTELNSIIESAKQEYIIEDSLNKLKEYLNTSHLSSYKHSSGAYIVNEWDDLYKSCKDYLDELNSMKIHSSYNIFEQKCNEWEIKLDRILQIFDIWMELQFYWLDLYGIIGMNKEVRDRLPLESAKYDNVTSDYKSILTRIFTSTKILDILKFPNCLESFSHILSSLKLIKSSLNDFIDNQRMRFPRFNFLSNEDILRILGSPSSAVMISSFCQKLFGTIKGLLIEDEIITGVISIEGEHMIFTSAISMVGKESNLLWLNDIDSALTETLNYQIQLAKAQINNGNILSKIIDHHVYQSVLVALQIIVTKKIDESIGLKDFRNLQTYLHTSVSSMIEVIYKIEDPLKKKKCINLLIELLQYRNFVDELHLMPALNRKVAWINRLKFYGTIADSDGLDNIYVSIGNNNIKYSYSYIGVPENLIRTESLLTAYVSLMHAFDQNYGSSLFGPAATGKTETTKSLGHSLGKTVVIFNCDDSFDIDSLTRIMGGICQLGVWCCFDEFNRLPKAILSAVASYLEAIQFSLTRSLNSVQLRQSSFKLHKDSRFIVTLNPTYEGRSELPTNLKKLFRSFSMSHADLYTISSVYLEMMGYPDWSDLSKTLSNLMLELDKQCTKQLHYDFGLRCLKTILRNAQILKKKDVHSRLKVLLNSIIQVISPKLNMDDTVLLHHLIRKYFNVDLPHIDNDMFISTLVNQMPYKYSAHFIQLCKHLYELQGINQSVIIMGKTGSGKSTLIKETLRAIKTLLGINTILYRIDTKTLTKEKLYGYINKVTLEWKDGVFTSIIRDIMTDSHAQYKDALTWIVFDSDIDPEYAEVLNSVLDDNRLLTLPTGERLNIPSNVKILFETQDLIHATMATISRSAMIWVSTSLYSSFALFKQSFENELSMLPDRLPNHDGWVENVIYPIRKLLTESILNEIIAKASQFSHVMFFIETRSLRNFARSLITELKKLQKYHFKLENVFLRRLLIFLIKNSLVLSFVADCCLEDQDVFLKLLNKLFNNSNGQLELEGDIFDVIFEEETLCFKPALSFIDNHSLQFQDITATDTVVETVDTVRQKHVILHLLTSDQMPILCGPAGSGKTMILTNSILNSKSYAIQSMSFSKETTVDNIINIIINNCEQKSTSNGFILSPKLHNKILVLFFDEINLTSTDRYGSQPVILFLRQLIETGGFWDYKTNQWATLENVKFVGACNPTEDLGRSELNSSFLRLTNIINIPHPNNKSLDYIYKKFYMSILKLVPQAKGYVQEFTSATIIVYQLFTETFSSDQNKHYIVSPREITRLTKGIYYLIINGNFTTLQEIIQLWIYECQRIFSDRLVTPEEKVIFYTLLYDTCHKYFPHQNITNLNMNEILFSNWLSLEYKKVHINELSKFIEQRFSTFCEETLEYNFVLHNECLKEIISVDRVLKQFQGHMMLIGPHKTGKTTIVKFVSWMNGIEVIQLNIHKNYTLDDFENFLRITLLECALNEKPICMLIDESNLTNPVYFERINSLLAKSDISDLFQGEEYDKLISDVSVKVRKLGLPIDTDKELYTWFVSQMSKNLHVIFEISKNITEDYSVLASPAMFNRCVIYWTNSWEPHTKIHVINHLLKPVPINVEIDFKNVDKNLNVLSHSIENNLHLLINCFMQIDDIFSVSSGTMESPSRLLNALGLFIGQYNNDISELEVNQRFMSNGLEKLNETVLEVKILNTELNDKKNEMELKESEANQTLDEMLIEQNEAERKHDATEDIKALLENQERIIEERKRFVIEKLASVEPLIEEAEKGVKGIKKAHLIEIKSMSHPPNSVKLTLEVMCILLGYNFSTWNDILNYIRKDNFINDILTFDTLAMISESVKEIIIDEYFSNKDFNFIKVYRASKVCGPLFKWIEAQLNFSDTLNNIEPLQKEVKSLESKTRNLQAKLLAAEDMIKDLQEKIITSKKYYSSTIRDIEKIKTEMKAIKLKLDNSNELVLSLTEEKTRWSKNLKLFGSKRANLLGNSFLTAIYVSYCCEWDETVRVSMLERARSLLRSLNIPFQEFYTYKNEAVDKTATSDWVQFGLPNEKFFIESFNMIIEPPANYLLLVDPNGTIIPVLSKVYGERFSIFSFLDENYIKRLENSIRFGEVALICDAEYYDSILDNIISKRYRSSAGRTSVIIGSKELDISKNFKLILHTKNYDYNIPSFMSNNLRVLNFKVSHASVEELTIKLSVENENANILKEYDEILSIERDTKTMLKIYGSQLLKELSSSEGSILENHNLVEILASMKMQSFQLDKRLSNSGAIMDKVSSTRSKYKMLGRHSSMIFKIFEQLSSFNWFYEFTVEKFLECVRTVIYNVGQSNSDSLLEYIVDKLYNAVIKTFALNLSQTDSELLTFSLYLLKIAIQNEYKNISEFKYIIKLMTSLNDYADNDITLVQLMELLRIAQTQGFSEMINFCRKRLTSESDFTLKDLVQLKPNINILCGNEKEIDGTYEIKKVALALNKELVVISLGDKSSIDFIEGQIIKAKDKNQWLLLQNAQLSGDWISSSLQKYLDHGNYFNELENNNSKEKRLKLFMTCDLFDTPMPIPILQKCYNYYCSNGGNIIDILLASWRNEITNESEIDKMSEYWYLKFVLSIIHSLIISINKLTGLGFNKKYDFNSIDNEFIMKIVFKSTSTVDFHELSFEYLKYILLNIVYGAKIDNESDFKILETIVTKILNNSNIPKQDSKFSEILPNIAIDNLYSHEFDSIDKFIKTIKEPSNSKIEWLQLPKEKIDIHNKNYSNDITEKLLKIFPFQDL
ncbi:hypothetical protein TPHA_0A03000 [Tetrapisispora phaffii CBS 4417]|uniref:Dynein heavy chain, cytoplasmic n=1 Tax=Tetrapisispora phaffii (strain ATCC 24235 / CBS 4417 / NBRC 1672 / NRRL Y-8282 / UCD 70-5) TaxID=1071381 RepID=G8BNA1_TETPH|nr:hypothetical protein TPHA_0A03000 [Tetrapisispora phaffii CBS 4417]CCE61379.1 hypothetical protein TPHA_0A03000 [Tetrapisispora phaffii CBS 4417]